ncbi:asparagine synthase (glutamine-hydrolyzing) [Algicella marina]|uniref:asparagine synthase (glutamine-hydrolyzing) n=1 Tax=Algicella marina TaxID=2683284 RepID=A0A6P1T4K5_9RHOB|nr:asparagine synthase (glutamine-hydrolyzing) [Algicella marina]QHQ36701.1 asparagine synthase (glutamine-hydrolyzing) [Algicella marina]
MCGIFGAIVAEGRKIAPARFEAMQTCLRHRGPDARGFDTDGRTTLGNVRLSIIDLSDASDQPLISEDGKVAVVQNGEIYNYIELREELRAEGAVFRTTGDTEVILHAFRHWGPDFVTRLNGMFAIAVHDRATGTTYLYRDRLGVKPLYLAKTEDGIFFASEIKALLAAGLPRQANLDALAQFFALNYIPAPHTAFAGIVHLMPGHMAAIGETMEIRRYWSLSGIRPDPKMTEAEAEAGLRRLLDDATRIRLRSDAPFGAFLSGGLDSTSVVASMRDHIEGEIRTYSIGFTDARFDETKWAEAAAKLFETQHVAKIVEQDITRLWPRFIYHCDQPHGDVSFMPTDQVSQLAVQDVKMVLTGDGGDELFAGYEKYLGIFPEGSAEELTAGWEDGYARASGLLHGDQSARLLTGGLFDAFHDSDPYRQLADAMRAYPMQDPINRVLLGDTTVLLPGNNLVKPDRMAMANSLEVRSPFLDYRMAEFAFTVPGWMKLKGGETKAVYKSAMVQRLGRDLTYRRKQMFTVPIGEWFKDTLTEYCRDMLLDGRLAARGLFDAAVVEEMLEAHVAGRENLTRQLRALISIEIWFRLFIDEDEDMLEQAA